MNKFINGHDIERVRRRAQRTREKKEKKSPKTYGLYLI